jgi:anti-sigma regulatory factor (Ser/Thr protein kinase)
MLIVRNELSEVARAAEWVADIAREEALSPGVAFRLDLCLEEVLANVVGYAFPDGGSHDVVVRCATDADWVILEVEDGGRPFDPLVQPLPCWPRRLADAGIGGRGVALIRHFAEESGYRREEGKNRLTLRWRRA